MNNEQDRSRSDGAQHDPPLLLVIMKEVGLRQRNGIVEDFSRHLEAHVMLEQVFAILGLVPPEFHRGSNTILASCTYICQYTVLRTRVRLSQLSYDRFIDFRTDPGYLGNQREGRIQSAERAVPTSQLSRSTNLLSCLTCADSRPT